MTLPQNLIIDSEPDYNIFIRWADDQDVTLFTIGTRSQWKRLSAIRRARHLAKRNPRCMVYVKEVHV